MLIASSAQLEHTARSLQTLKPVYQIKVPQYFRSSILIVSLAFALSSCGPSKPPNAPTVDQIFCSTVVENPIEGNKRKPVATCSPRTDPNCTCEEVDN